MAKATIPNGTTFRSCYADANPTWTVVGPRGNDTYDCEIKQDLDYGGTKKVFGGEEIRRARQSETFWDSLVDESEAWWNQRQIGEIVHYHNGFGEFVRGVIVYEPGEKGFNKEIRMRPIALVGNWKPYDLPRRQANGDIYLPYHAEGVAKGKTMRPSATSMFEHPGFSPNPRARDFDPRTAEPINLSVPDMTPKQAKAAKLEKLREQVTQAAQEQSVDAMLARLQTILAQAAEIKKEPV